MRGLLLLAGLFLLSGCARVDTDNAKLDDQQAVPPAMPLAWRQPPDGHDFVSLALSGGGTKAAIFAGETMFYLQALGVLQHAAMVSSVSGGSFAAGLYAVACDPSDNACAADRPHGRTRPVWSHDAVLHVLGTGYQQLLDEQIARLLVPGVPASISGGRFAAVIDRDYLGAGRSEPPFLFADINPRRPRIVMNSTITSEARGGLESDAQPPCVSYIGRGVLRRRTPDEYFHFAFSDFYFGLFRSDLSRYPLAAAIAASAAFPALIDNVTLRDWCAKPAQRDVLLMDGGANDNQALIEIYDVLAELVFGQHRSYMTEAQRREASLRPGDRAWVFVVNSSVTETTGSVGASGGQPYGALAFFSALLSKVNSAIDTYSAEGYNLRKQAYLAQMWVADTHRHPPIKPVEISLTELDQYVLGGTEAALRGKAAIRPAEAESDLNEALSLGKRPRQEQAFRTLVTQASPAQRHALGLSDYHPQCYFNIRAQLDASLVSLPDDGQACLREAARWAVALRAQEICDSAAGGTLPPAGMRCVDGRPELVQQDALGQTPDQAGALKGVCAHMLTVQSPESADQPDVLCRRL